MPRILHTLAPALLILSALSLQAQSPANCTATPVSDHGKSVDGKPLASPPVVVQTDLNNKPVIIHYNAPSMRCRTIMGELVPYGQVWRTGANPATSFTTAGDIMVGTLRVPKGKYTLYTLPAASGTDWQLILSKQTGQWGTEYHQEQDLGRIPMHAATLSAPQEVMSLSFEKITSSSAQLHIRWEKTDEWVGIKAAS